MIQSNDVTPEMIDAVLAKLKQAPKCGVTVLKFKEPAEGRAIHECTKDERHPGRHSDGERAWS